MDELLRYYLAEMKYLSNEGVDFAKRHGKVAHNLNLNDQGSSDPHVQRLLESFAFLTGKLQKSLDDQESFFSTSLVDIIYPMFSRPVPSCTVVKFNFKDSILEKVAGNIVPAGTELSISSTAGNTYKFRTTYDVRLNPLSIEEAKITKVKNYDLPLKVVKSPWVISIKFSLNDLFKKEYFIDKLTIYLKRDKFINLNIYDLINSYDLSESLAFYSVDGKSFNELGKFAVKCLGFSDKDWLFEKEDSVHPALPMLLEYSVFPEKFMFFEINFGEIFMKDSLEIVIPLGEKVNVEESILDKELVELNCAPAVNLFEKFSEPILLSYKKTKYHLIPDQRKHETTEIYKIKEVTSSIAMNAETKKYDPYFSFSHEVEKKKQSCFWLAERKKSTLYEGTDVHLSFVSDNLDFEKPASEVVYARILCTNRGAASGVPQGAIFDTNLETAGIYATNLIQPTKQIDIPMNGKYQWKLIKQLSIDHIGIDSEEDCKNMIKEVFSIFDFIPNPHYKINLDSIEKIVCQRSLGILTKESWTGFVQQLSINIDFQNFVSNSLFFSLVLDHFFNSHLEFNTLLETNVTHGGRICKKWKLA